MLNAKLNKTIKFSKQMLVGIIPTLGLLYYTLSSDLINLLPRIDAVFGGLFVLAFVCARNIDSFIPSKNKYDGLLVVTIDEDESLELAHMAITASVDDILKSNELLLSVKVMPENSDQFPDDIEL